jgi:hypothetical protein
MITNLIKWHEHYDFQKGSGLSIRCFRILIPSLPFWVLFLVYKVKRNNLGLDGFPHSE